jgi:hypothetical protein
MKNKQKGFIVPLVVTIIAILLIGTGIYLYYQHTNSAAPVLSAKNVTTNNNASAGSTFFDDSDLRISQPASIPVADNSASLFSAIPTGAISATDQSFITAYVTDYPSKSFPSLASAEKVIAKYPNLLSTFATAAIKQYQCSSETCSLQTIRNITNLAALESLVYFQQGKATQAESVATDIIAVGKSVSANTNDLITLLVGWSAQNLGYHTLSIVRPAGATDLFTQNEKNNLIAALHTQEENVLVFPYTGETEMIDYITSSNNKPTDIVLTPDDESMVNTYRQGATASANAWNPLETKKYFYESYSIELSNAALPCGATLATSTIDIGFNPNNTQTENYVGKTLYTTAFSPLSVTLSQKRCQIENLIQSL